MKLQEKIKWSKKIKEKNYYINIIKYHLILDYKRDTTTWSLLVKPHQHLAFEFEYK